MSLKTIFYRDGGNKGDIASGSLPLQDFGAKVTQDVTNPYSIPSIPFIPVNCFSNAIV
jgi:hypothetical protein